MHEGDRFVLKLFSLKFKGKRTEIENHIYLAEVPELSPYYTFFHYYKMPGYGKAPCKILVKGRIKFFNPMKRFLPCVQFVNSFIPFYRTKVILYLILRWFVGLVFRLSNANLHSFLVNKRLHKLPDELYKKFFPLRGVPCSYESIYYRKTEARKAERILQKINKWFEKFWKKQNKVEFYLE